MYKKQIIGRLTYAMVAVFVFTLATMRLQAQSELNSPISAAEAERIINSFTTKEAEFRRALNSYSFKRDAIIQSIGMGGQVVGEYHRVSNFTFDDQGNRYEKISFFPMSSMPEVTQEDIDDLGGIEPFALEPSKISRYNIRYVGKEKIDELIRRIAAEQAALDARANMMTDQRRQWEQRSASESSWKFQIPQE